MIQAVLDYFAGRCGKVLLDGDPIEVYPWGPHREIGEIQYPSFALTLADVQPDLERARPCEELFIPSEDEVTIEFPIYQGGGTMTGPASFTVKPYPTPVKLLVQLDVRTASKNHAVDLTSIVYDLFPIHHSALINDFHVRFGVPKIETLDELARPHFWTAYRWWCRNVWIDRLTSYEVSSLRDPRLELSTMEEDA